MPDITWIAAGAGQASEPTNWSLGRAPQNGDRVIWDGTSDNNCDWNLDKLTVTADGWVITVNYDGTIAQNASVDIGIGSLGYDQSGGVATFQHTRKIYCASSFMVNAGSITSGRLNIVMTVDGSTIQLPSVGAMGVEAQANVTLTSTSTGFTAQNLKTHAGKRISIASGKAIGSLLYTGYTFVNDGEIVGPGSLHFTLFNSDRSIVFGNVNCAVTIYEYFGSVENRTLSLGADAVLGSSLTILSSSATYTITLSHGTNYTLQVAGAVTLGARSIMVQGSGQWTFGSYTQNGVSSSFNQGGPVSVLGDTAISDGTIDGHTNKWSNGGNFVKSGGELVSVTFWLEMTGTGKSFSLNNLIEFYRIDISGYVTLNGAQTFTGPRLKVTGSLILASASGVAYFSAGRVVSSFVNTGVIGGTNTLQFRHDSANTQDYTVAMGVINCPVAFSSTPSVTRSCKATLSASPVLGSGLSVSSAHASNTMTLDLAGHSLQANGITVGTRGALKTSGGKVINQGNFDSSNGSIDMAGSQYVQASPGTIKLAAGQSLNDLIVRSAAAGSALASNVTVNGIYAHVPDLIQGAYSLTYNKDTEYTGKRRPLRKLIKKKMVWESLADMLLLEDIERVSA